MNSATLATAALCLALFAAVLCLARAEPCRDVIVRGMKIYVGGNEFYIRGMLYRPEPLAISTIDHEGSGGSGACSPRETVLGSGVSACAGFDYFSEHWSDLWDRDLPRMKDIGVNTVRIRDLDDYTKQYVQRFNDPEVVSPEHAVDHGPFFDAVHAHGLYVIAPLLSNALLMHTGPDLETLQRFIEARVDELGDHPALLMFTVGDAMADLGSNKELRDRVDWCMFYARKYMSHRHGRRVPLTTVMVDVPSHFATIARQVQVDLFMANVGFRGLNLNPVFDGDGGSFPGFAALNRQYDRPLVVGEWGMYNADRQASPEWVNVVWKEIVEHLRYGSSGGVFHQYMDTSAASADARMRNTGVMIPSASGGPLDNVQPRTDVYNALKSGYPGQWQGMNYNNEDIWGLASFWQPATRTSVDISTCPSYPTQDPPLGFDPEPYPDSPGGPGAGGDGAGGGGGGGWGGGGGGGGTGGGGGGGGSDDTDDPFSSTSSSSSSIGPWVNPGPFGAAVAVAAVSLLTALSAGF